MNDVKDVPVITIDGPSGTGKGTITHLLAAHLGWHCLDSGALYRALAIAARLQDVDLIDEHELARIAQALDLNFEMDNELNAHVFLAKHDITQQIRSEQCGQDASKMAAYPLVRDALLARQRAFARLPGLVTDGRDMGTVVFPNAVLKIFLYASPEERTNRRYLQLKKKGNNASLAQVAAELTERDARDTARAHAPLKPAQDSHVLDTTELNIDQVFESVLELARCWGKVS